MRFCFVILSIISFFCSFSFAITSPTVSANALFLYQNSNHHGRDLDALNLDSRPNGLDVQEAELQFASEVDPFTRLRLLLSISPSYQTDGATVTQEWDIEPEEVFAESNALGGTTLRVGKFKMAFGKHNLLHPHAFPLVEAPLANVALLGDEGLNDTGISLAILIPTPWFNELSLQYLKGKGDESPFNAASPGEGVGLIHWKNLLDVSESLTAEFGVSYAKGVNSYLQTTSLEGADVTFRWIPLEGGKYTSLSWSTEFISRRQGRPDLKSERAHGISSWAQFQFLQRWISTYRYDNLEVKNSFAPSDLLDGTTERHTAGLMFAPTEFSSYKFEVAQKKGPLSAPEAFEKETIISVQANFTIGAHPAHAY